LGSACFIAVAAPVATLAYFLEANVNSLAVWGEGGPIGVSLTMALICGTAATLIASIAESWKTKLTDNLRRILEDEADGQSAGRRRRFHHGDRHALSLRGLVARLNVGRPRLP
jgi:hypothetical protein